MCRRRELPGLVLFFLRLPAIIASVLQLAESLTGLLPGVVRSPRRRSRRFCLLVFVSPHPRAFFHLDRRGAPFCACNTSSWSSWSWCSLLPTHPDTHTKRYPLHSVQLLTNDRDDGLTTTNSTPTGSSSPAWKPARRLSLGSGN